MKAVALLFALVAASFAADLNLHQLEQELMDSPLVDIDEGLSRMRKFSFSSVAPIFHKACHCEKTTCECCVTPSILGTKVDGCFKFAAQPASRTINVSVTALQNTLLSKSFSTSEKGKYCGKLPGKANFLSFCLETVTSGNDQTGITFCSELNVNMKTITALSVNFRCVEWKDGKITFSENNLPADNGVLNVKARTVFKKVIDFIKKP